jgi:hypothetical protein
MRSCGDCTACCTLMGVPSLGKPMGAACAHARDGRCHVYDQRPAECRAFCCWWLAEGGRPVQYLREAERPDLSGVLVSLKPPGAAFKPDMLVLRGDLDGWPAGKMVKRLERRHLLLLVRADGRARFTGPERAMAALGFRSASTDWAQTELGVQSP